MRRRGRACDPTWLARADRLPRRRAARAGRRRRAPRQPRAGHRAFDRQVPLLGAPRRRRPAHAAYRRLRARRGCARGVRRARLRRHRQAPVRLDGLRDGTGRGPDVAQRVFRALEIERAVYYLQETIPHDGVDVRAMVVGDRVVASIERLGTGWRANLARGASAARSRWTTTARRCACGPPRRSAPTTPAWTCFATPTVATTCSRSTRIPGWHGVEGATGVDVAAALVEHLERGRDRRGSTQRVQLVGRDRAVVQRGGDQGAGRPGVGQRAEVGGVANAAAGEQLEVGEAGVQLARAASRRVPRRSRRGAGRARSPRVRRRPRGTRARRPRPCRTAWGRARSARRRAGRGSARAARRAARLRRRRNASAPGSVSVPITTRAAPSSRRSAIAFASAVPASTMTRASCASAATTSAFPGPPAIASRSATYSSSRPNRSRTARARPTASAPSAIRLRTGR